MEEKEKDGNYALNTFKDIWKYDPLRLLDLGNSFQVLMSQKKPEVDEEARASSNFEKLTEDKPRPISHTLVDATRLIPDVVSILGPALAKAGVKAIGKAATKKATKGVAKKLVNEGTSDAANLLSKSKFLPRDEKVMAGKKWVRNLFEDKNAMERVAGKKLSDKEVEAIRKNINEFVPHKIEKYNTDVDKLKDIYKKLNIKNGSFETKDDLVKYLNKNKKSLGLTDVEYKNLLKNIDVLPDAKISSAHLPVDRIIENTTKGKVDVLKNIKDVPQYIPLVVPGLAEKASEAVLNDGLKTKFQTNDVIMRPDYYVDGSEPTPITDFIASMFNVDYDDPARFNKKDIDAFFDFLEESGTIEPGIKDKWTPRQKVSVMRKLLKDKDHERSIKNMWSVSKQRKNLKDSYKDSYGE